MNLCRIQNIHEWGFVCLIEFIINLSYKKFAMIPEISKQNFYKYWNSLINYAVTFKIRREDAEDIATDSILKALEYFKKDRGDFETFCRFILKRRVLNFKKVYADTYLLLFIDDKGVIIDTENDHFDEKETNELSNSFLKRLETQLDEKELKLFNALTLYCHSSEKISVSAAAGNIGLDMKKGWDLFRKIQRKARQLNNNEIYEDDNRLYSKSRILSKETVSVSDIDFFIFPSFREISHESKFDSFLNSLSYFQKRAVKVLYRN